MTIVVAVRKGNRAAIASDTAESDGDLLVPGGYRVNAGKIFRHQHAYIGLAGWSATFDIFEDLLRSNPEDFEFDSRQNIFASALRMHKHLKEDYFIETSEDEKDQPVESSQLLALILSRHGIFELHSYRSVNEYTKFWAIGSGRQIALGALHALYDRYRDPKAIAQAAVEAACEFDSDCSLPLHVHGLSLK